MNMHFLILEKDIKIIGKGFRKKFSDLKGKDFHTYCSNFASIIMISCFSAIIWTNLNAYSPAVFFKKKKSLPPHCGSNMVSFWIIPFCMRSRDKVTGEKSPWEHLEEQDSSASCIIILKQWKHYRLRMLVSLIFMFAFVFVWICMYFMSTNINFLVIIWGTVSLLLKSCNISFSITLCLERQWSTMTKKQECHLVAFY